MTANNRHQKNGQLATVYPQSIAMTSDPNLNFEQPKKVTPYQIEEQHVRPRFDPMASWSARIVFALKWLALVFYLHIRLAFCRSAKSIGYVPMAREWCLFFCELLLLMPEVLMDVEFFTYLHPTNARNLDRPSLRITGHTAPLIHVLVTTCGEDLDIIMDTVTAAAWQDYPSESYQVFVLDDANSEQLRRAVNKLNEKGVGSSHPVVHLARQKTDGVPHHYKSGNLRFGLETTLAAFGGSDYFAALDADMIPESDWLCRTVPHLIRHDDVAVVSPPQQSYNISATDSMGQDTAAFAQIYEPLHDRHNFSHCSGSGYVMRRSALDSIDGWPLSNLGEDILCSYLLLDAGWRTIFIQDQVQFGLMPGSFHAYISQRLRWTLGSLLLAIKCNFFLPLGVSGYRCTPIQRFFAVLHAFKAHAIGSTTIVMAMLPMLMLSFWVFPPTDHTAFGRDEFRVPHLFLWLSGTLLKHLTVSSCIGTANAAALSGNRYWSAPYHFTCVIQSIMNDLSSVTFKVTGAFKCHLNERSARDRAPLFQRLTDPFILMHACFGLYAAAALISWLCLVHPFQAPSKVYAYTPLAIRLLTMVISGTLPVRYMISPPTVPERRELLVADKYGVLRSKRKDWNKRDGSTLSVGKALTVGIVLWLDWL